MPERSIKEKLVRCALYSRVSSRNQLDGEYNSLETQRERLEAYVKSQPYHVVHDAYEDGGYSAKDLQRPKLQAMLSDIRAGLIDCVLAYKIDRLTRNQRDFYRLVEFFEQHNVTFVSITQHFDTASAMGRLMRNIMLEFAQFEREMTGERTRDKMDQRAAKGYWNGGGVPFGYQARDKQLVIHREEAETVRMFFQVFAGTGSLAKVREEAKLRGLKTRAGGPWGKTSIDNIIRNPIYAGKLRYKEQIRPGSHEAIIEESLFLKAQSVHRTQTHSTTRTKRAFLLRGLLRCSDCGSTMIPHYTKKRTKNGFENYFYYRCTKAMHYDKSVCGIRQIGASTIETLVLDDIGQLISESPILISAIGEMTRNCGSQIESLKSELKRLRTRIHDLEQEACNYVEALGKGRLSAERLEKALEKNDAQKSVLKTRERDIENQINENEMREFDHKLIQENLRKFRVTFSKLNDREKPECLQMILKEVVLGKETVQLSIYDLPEFNYSPRSSQIRTERLLR